MPRVFIGRDAKSCASRLNKCLRQISEVGKVFIHVQTDLFLKYTVMAVV